MSFSCGESWAAKVSGQFWGNSRELCVLPMCHTVRTINVLEHGWWSQSRDVQYQSMDTIWPFVAENFQIMKRISSGNLRKLEKLASAIFGILWGSACGRSWGKPSQVVELSNKLGYQGCAMLSHNISGREATVFRAEASHTLACSDKNHLLLGPSTDDLLFQLRTARAWARSCRAQQVSVNRTTRMKVPRYNFKNKSRDSSKLNVWCHYNDKDLPIGNWIMVDIPRLWLSSSGSSAPVSSKPSRVAFALLRARVAIAVAYPCPLNYQRKINNCAISISQTSTSSFFACIIQASRRDGEYCELDKPKTTTFHPILPNLQHFFRAGI